MNVVIRKSCGLSDMTDITSNDRYTDLYKRLRVVEAENRRLHTLLARQSIAQGINENQTTDNLTTTYDSPVPSQQLHEASATLPLESTEFQLTKDALQFSEARFHAVVESLFDGLAILTADRDEEHHFLDFILDYINKAGCRINRCTRQHVLGHSISMLFPSSRAHPLFTAFQQVLESGETYNGVYILENFSKKDPSRYIGLDIQAVKFGDGLVVTWRDITARLQAEKERDRLLVEIERHRGTLQTVMQRIPVGIAILRGPDFIHEMVNPIFQTLAFNKPIVGLPFAKVWQNATGDALPILQKVMQTGKTFHADDVACLVQRSATSAIEDAYYTFSYYRIYDVDGQPSGILISAIDTTAQVASRTQIEVLARETSRRADEFGAIIAALVDPLITYDKHGRILRANPSMESLLGANPVGLSVLEVFTRLALCRPDGLPVALTLHDESNSYRQVITNMNGKESRYQVMSAALIDDEKRWGTVMLFHDISEREHLLEELEHRFAELDATISSIADGLIIYSPEGRIVQLNQAARRIVPYSPDEIAATVDMRIAWSATAAREANCLLDIERTVRRALRGEIIHGTVIALQRTDKRLWLTMSAAPITNFDGIILGAVISLTDITMVQELQERQSIFVQTVSHDIRAPLTTISGHAQLLRDTITKEFPENDFIRLCTDAITRNVRRLNIIIEDLVDTVRLEGGQLRLSKERILLQEFFTAFTRRSEAMFDMSRIHITVPEDLPAVNADTNRLERIIINLVSNALKYSPVITPVHVNVYPEVNEVIISVIDQGIGIADTDLPHLFERFYRGTTTRKAEGIGLGLYITKMLVEAQQGRIWVQSAPGCGSTFTFTLPICPLS